MKAVEYLETYELEQVVIDIAAYDDDNDKNGTEGYADEFYTTNITMKKIDGDSQAVNKVECSCNAVHILGCYYCYYMVDHDCLDPFVLKLILSRVCIVSGLLCKKTVCPVIGL